MQTKGSLFVTKFDIHLNRRILIGQSEWQSRVVCLKTHTSRRAERKVGQRSPKIAFPFSLNKLDIEGIYDFSNIVWRMIPSDSGYLGGRFGALNLTC